jgi:hypothetical protein
LAINNDAGLPKRSPNRFRRLPSQPAIPQHHFLCRPHTTTTSLTYRPTLSIFSPCDKVLRRPVETTSKSGHRATYSITSSARARSEAGISRPKRLGGPEVDDRFVLRRRARRLAVIMHRLFCTTGTIRYPQRQISPSPPESRGNGRRPERLLSLMLVLPRSWCNSECRLAAGRRVASPCHDKAKSRLLD